MHLSAGGHCGSKVILMDAGRHNYLDRCTHQTPAEDRVAVGQVPLHIRDCLKDEKRRDTIEEHNTEFDC